MSRFISSPNHAVLGLVEAFYDGWANFLYQRLPGISLLPGAAAGPMSETFGERLRRLRNEQGYTAVDLAAAVGTSEGTIRQLESGNVKSPNFLLGIRLADQLKVDARYLALGEGLSVGARFDAVERRIAALERRVAAIPAARR